MPNPIRAAVFYALDNAVENGYTFDGMSVEDIALDMNRCFDEVEEVPHTVLMKWIKSWLMARPSR